MSAHTETDDVALPAIIDNMSRGWNRDPAGVALGAAREGMSAALWTHDDDDVQEVSAEPDHDQFLVGFPVIPFFSELTVDGEAVFARTVEPWAPHIIQPGLMPRAVHRGRFAALHLYVPKSVIHAACEELSVQHVELIDMRCTPDARVARIGKQTLDEMRSGEMLSRLRIDVLAQDLAIQLLRRHSTVAGSRQVRQAGVERRLAGWQVKRAAELIMSDLAADLPLHFVAGAVGLSPYYFARAFKASTGLPPHRYLIQLRIRKARELLGSTDLPILEIAARVGYDDPSYFARLFRREVGVTPAAYRRERRR